jgi:hypothetical protein
MVRSRLPGPGRPRQWRLNDTSVVITAFDFEWSLSTLRVVKQKTLVELPSQQLVTNNRTTKEEIAAWEQLGEEFGTKVNSWNLSLYGGAPLSRAMGDVHLGREFAKKTVVMLNNEFDPEKGGSSPVGHLADRDFLLSSVKNRTSAYVVGGSVDVKRELFANMNCGSAYRARVAPG